MPPDPLATELDAYLSSRGSPLAGYGQTFVRAGRRYRLDPRLLVAIAGAETSFGTTGNAAKINNPFGWGPHIPFASWDEGINTVARGLRKGYLSQGLNTIQQIGGKWAPQGASNDPTNLNSNWAKNVSRFYAELGGKGISRAATRGARPVPVPPSAAGTAGSGGVDPRRQLALSTLSSIAAGQYDPVQALAQVAEARANQWGGTTKPPVSPKTGRMPQAASDSVNGVIRSAAAQIGKPYVWGGETPGEGGFDCSGLIDYALRQNGVNLPERLTTHNAAKYSRPVKGIPQPGDWLLSEGHMVLYVGNGQVLAAPRTGEVVQYQGAKQFLDRGFEIRRPNL